MSQWDAGLALTIQLLTIQPQIMEQPFFRRFVLSAVIEHNRKEVCLLFRVSLPVSI